jgi:hypothetical protein
MSPELPTKYQIQAIPHLELSETAVNLKRMSQFIQLWTQVGTLLPSY